MENKNINNDFPGYPHYPPKEDIMSASSEMKRVDVDVENLTPSVRVSKVEESLPNVNPTVEPVSFPASGVDEIRIVPGTQADVTKDDLRVLNAVDENNEFSADVSGDDLDIPGAELDDKDEQIGEEDEENNYYSLGGDLHED